MQYEQLSVWQPDGTKKRAWTVTSNEDHAGLRVAEGIIEPGDYWQDVASAYRGQLAAQWRKYVAERDAREAAAYAEDWVARWLAYD